MPQYVAGYDLEENLDPDATAPYTDEFTVGVERELATDFSLAVTFVYKHKQNIFEDVNDFGLSKEEAWKGYSEDSPYFERFDFLDPGDDGEFGTEVSDVSRFAVERVAPAKSDPRTSPRAHDRGRGAALRPLHELLHQYRCAGFRASVLSRADR